MVMICSNYLISAMGKLGQINRTSNSITRSVISDRGDNIYYFKSNLQIVNAVSQEDLHSVHVICRNTLLASFVSIVNRINFPCSYTVFQVTFSQLLLIRWSVFVFYILIPSSIITSFELLELQ